MFDCCACNSVIDNHRPQHCFRRVAYFKFKLSRNLSIQPSHFNDASLPCAVQGACIALLLCLLQSTSAQPNAVGLNTSMLPMAIEEGSPGQFWTKITATLQYPQAAADWNAADARAPAAAEINSTIWAGLKQLQFQLVKTTTPAFQGFTFSVDVYTLAPTEYVNLRKDLHTVFSDVARGAVVTVSSSRLIPAGVKYSTQHLSQYHRPYMS